MASSEASSSKTSSGATQPPHYFPTPALDHAFSGIVAGTVATVCMNPLDLVKVQFQVDTSTRKRATATSPSSPSSWRSLARKATGGDVVRDMSTALKNIVKRDGYSGLYRGLSPNVVGNSASWGFYFLWYTMIKEYMAAPTTSNGKNKKLSPGQHLLAASESGAITALMTNPIWVVKTRMFTTTKSGKSIIPETASTSATLGSTSSTYATLNKSSTSTVSEPTRYRGLIQGLGHIWKHEGWRGLYKGAGLALVGVSNGAIQFVCYEELKRWRMGVANAKQHGMDGIPSHVTFSKKPSDEDDEEEEEIKLDNIEYIVMSGVAKLAAISLTYPYQVVRSRIQNHSTSHIYPNIPTCIRLTWQKEGFRGFYKGMAANAIRILPGTCVTFVVYENCSWALRGLAERKSKRRTFERQQESITSR
jgi:solute carrier family 25 folate transporter 32